MSSARLSAIAVDGLAIDSVKSILARLGKNSVQNYILTLGRELSGIASNPTKVEMQATLDFGADVLQYLLDTGVVIKDGHTSAKTGNGLVVDIVPVCSFDELVEAHSKDYPIRCEHSSRLHRDEILHSCDIASIGTKNAELLRQQNNIPLLVRKCNLRGSKRVPKDETNASHPNYVLETKLLQSYLKEYDERVVFMNHSFDRRGRLYTMSYPLSFQADEYTRSAIELANKERVSADGLQWLRLDIANLAGFDKHTASSRLEWFSQAESAIIACGRTGKYDRRLTLFNSVDKPIRLVSACKAYVDALEGRGTSYMCSIDATASGQQLMAILTRDSVMAKFTNLTSEDKRYDIYSEVAREFYALKSSANRFRYLSDRKRFKSSIMISGYNGKKQVENDFPTEAERELFYKAMRHCCAGVEELTELVNLAYMDNCDKPYMAWIAPDGFQCVIPQFKAKWARIVRKDFQCMFKYEVIEPSTKDNKRSLLPNFIHSVDGFVCRELLRRCGEMDIDVMSVHDSFYAHPNHMGVILKIYNEILQELNEDKYNIVANFLTDIYGEKMANPFSDRPMLDDIRNARYSLC